MWAFPYPFFFIDSHLKCNSTQKILETVLFLLELGICGIKRQCTFTYIRISFITTKMQISMVLLEFLFISSILAFNPLRFKQCSWSKVVPQENLQTCIPQATLGPNTPPKIEIIVYTRPPLNSTLNTEELLKTFIGHLKMFVLGSLFAIDEFEWAAHKLEKILVDISKAVDEEMPNEVLGEHLHFARVMFQTMVEGLAHLKYYNTLSLSEVLLVNQLVHINIATFGLCNNYGWPDPKIKGYISRVLRLTETLDSCEDHYRKLQEVSYGIRFMFESQFLRVKRAIMVLDSYIKNT